MVYESNQSITNDGINFSGIFKMMINIKSSNLLCSEFNASDLFGIGQHKLREIISEDYGSKYHLMFGRTIKIKRKPFEEFIEQVEQI